MTQTVLNETPEKVKKNICRTTLFCILLAAVVLGINLLLALCFTERTYLPFLLVNIVLDIAAGCTVIVLLDRIRPKRTLLSLQEKAGSTVEYRIASVSETSLRYLDLDCREVKTDGRTLFLPCGTVTLRAGETYRLRTASNVITEAEQ